MKLSSEQIRETAAYIGIASTDLEVLVNQGAAVEYQQGDYLFHESNPRRWFGVILQGDLELHRGLTSRHLLIGKMTEGALIGEGLLIDESVHSLSALAANTVVVWQIPREAVESFRHSHPDAFYRIVAHAARRIQERLREATAHQLTSAADSPAATSHRLEHDSLGTREISNAHYYGVQTVRALENFPFSGTYLYLYQHFVNALAFVKKAAALANGELEVLPPDITDAIVVACDRILDGELHEQFVVDMIQGGAGTSTNMNANEVIANAALEHLGLPKGQYDRIHPNDHVNRSQSTNDTYPTAVKIGVVLSLQETLSALGELQRAFQSKAEEFADVLKMGRTENQDAVPMTLGQEFAAYAVMVEDGIRRLRHVADDLLVVNMGATAIGTGLNSPPGYAARCVQHLAELTGLPIRLAGNLVEATQDAGDFAVMSSALKVTAIQISKICNDLRWASSGPRCGLHEINLPPLQPGSSIMPGKVNPVLPEVVNQISYQIIGSDTTVSMAAEASEFELNMAEPIIAYNLLSSLMLLKNAAVILTNRCILGITANRARCADYVKHSIGIVTALNPVLGYERSAAIAKEALATGRSVYDLVIEKGWLEQAELDALLEPARMANPLRHAE